MVEMFIVDSFEDNRVHLAIAPISTYINRGDLVVMEGEGQKFRRAYSDSYPLDEDGELFRMFKTMARNKVLKAVGKYRLDEFDWVDMDSIFPQIDKEGEEDE